MGYVSKDIAQINEPKKITLSGNPNFIRFSSKPHISTFCEAHLTVNAISITADIETVTMLDITVKKTGQVFSFHGTTDKSKVSENVYFVADTAADTVENLRQAMLKNTWLAANFEITIPFVASSSGLTNGVKLYLISAGTGEEYNIGISAGNAYILVWVNETSVKGDSISGEDAAIQIDLDVYADPRVDLGREVAPTESSLLGTFITTLSKTYMGGTLWFDLNAVFGDHIEHRVPKGAVGYFATGTLRAFRVVAMVKGTNNSPFYVSDALYLLNGRRSLLDAPDLSGYMYSDGGSVKLLTNKPRTTYVRGQAEYLNFILAESGRFPEYSLLIRYDAYNTAGTLLGTVYGPEMKASDWANTVLTCELDMSVVLDAFPNAGIIRVCLSRDNDVVSNEIEYEVRPECLHTLRQFSFLNSLGGWDAFNFDAALTDEIKPSIETYDKTITPYFQRGDSAETVYGVSLNNTFTVKGAPVPDTVAVWLKELAEARVILDGGRNYIVIDEFTLQISDDNKNMQQPTIKYHLSE